MKTAPKDPHHHNDRNHRLSHTIFAHLVATENSNKVPNLMEVLTKFKLQAETYLNL